MLGQPDYTLYVITERWGGRTHLEVAQAALAGGATTIQLREKELPPEQVLEEARQIARLCRQAGVCFIVNDHLALAAQAGADGVHVGSSDADPAQARRELGLGAIVGVSAASLQEALAAAPHADYLGVGPVYGTATKLDAGPPLGGAGLAAIRRAVTLPLVAIGGINADNLAPLLKAGAQGIAVISAVTREADMAEATRRLRRAITEARRDGKETR